MAYTRRRFLTLASAAALFAPAAQAFRWQGTALGARAQFIFDHPEAERVAARARAEIDRLEDIFSLYRPGSSLCRLNDAGFLAVPPFELLECLATARRAYHLTRGLFDPTVQPLWQVTAEAWAHGAPPAETDIARARASIGFRRVAFDSSAILLGAGQQLTLNGIAQGYIADRVARLMRAEGIDDVLIDTGEIIASGQFEDRGGWPVRIAKARERLLLTNRALATSALEGTVLDSAGRIGHILDPGARPKARFPIRQISISAFSAACADALTTGLCLAADLAEVSSTLERAGDARLEDIRLSSSTP